jgi:hypothetical protein
MLSLTFATSLLFLVGCGSSPESLAKDFVAAVNAGDAGKTVSIFQEADALTSEKKKQFQEAFMKEIGGPLMAVPFFKKAIPLLGDKAPADMKIAIQAIDAFGKSGMEDLLKGAAKDMEKMGKEFMKGMEKMGQDFFKGFPK